MAKYKTKPNWLREREEQRKLAGDFDLYANFPGFANEEITSYLREMKDRLSQERELILDLRDMTDKSLEKHLLTILLGYMHMTLTQVQKLIVKKESNDSPEV